jgi:hypothetical protein
VQEGDRPPPLGSKDGHQHSVPGATVRTIALLFAVLMVGAASGEAKVACKLPMYIQAPPAPGDATTDTVNLFLYGLKSTVRQHQGCLVDKMNDAHLGLYITTLNLVNAEGPGEASVIAVALAVPLNGVPVYMDHYVLILRETEAIDGQVNALLESIGETLNRHTLPGQ